MWMLLLACGTFDDLVPSEPIRGPIPSLEAREGALEAPAIVRPMPAPPLLADLDDEELLDDLSLPRPPFVGDVRAQVLAHPDGPLLRLLVERWADDPTPATRQLLGFLLSDRETCEAVLAFDDGTFGADTYDGCPWTSRPDVVARYPAAAERDAWRLTPLPDNLASGFVEGTWVPDAVVRNYPEQREGRVRRALERCADDGSTTAASCAQALASVEWSAARDRRSSLPEGPTKTALERFDTGADVEAWLDEQGFAPRRDDAPIEAGSLMDRLRHRDALWESFGAWERVVLLLEQLGVDDAVFHVVPQVDGERYATLYAYTAGRRTRVLLDPAYGEDVPQLVGLANRLAREAGSDHRALWIEDEALGWVAVIGPSGALSALVDAELVTVPAEPFRESLAPIETPLLDTGSKLDFDF